MIHGLRRGDLFHFFDVTEAVVAGTIRFYGSQPGWQLKNGGYFCLADSLTGSPFIVAAIGAVPVEKTQRYMGLAVEKAKRLADHPGQRTSWESRNPENDQWSGAVWCDRFIFSFSGLPELGDEAAMLAVILRCHPSRENYVYEVAHMTRNPLFTHDYWEALRQG
jgi:hypothetical protein